MVRLADAVLFDLDGVLIDSYEVWFRVMNAAARELGYGAIERAAFHAVWGQGLEADQERFFPRHAIAEVGAAYDAHFPAHLAHLHVNGDVPAVFDGLAERGIPSAVVTNTPGALARELVARTGVVPDAVVGGDEVPQAKPAPDMVLRACALLGVAPVRALVVGDSRFDREAARAAGARFAGLGIEGGELTLTTLGELVQRL